MPAKGDECKLKIGNRSFPVRMVDQSISGIRVEGVFLYVLTTNAPMELEHCGESFNVVCRNVSRVGEKEFSLGLEHADDRGEDTEPPRILINPYVVLDGMNVLCSPKAAVSNSVVLAELPGKQEFQVDSKKIETRTAIERQKELASCRSLDDLAKFYSNALGVEMKADSRDILLYEFGLGS